MSLITLVPSAARTADGTASFNGWTPDLPISLQLDITAISGTSPNLSLYVEQTYDDGSNWSTIGNFINGVTATGQYRLVVEDQQPATGNYRLRWALVGTSPSVTFSVIAHGRP